MILLLVGMLTGWPAEVSEALKQEIRIAVVEQGVHPGSSVDWNTGTVELSDGKQLRARLGAFGIYGSNGMATVVAVIQYPYAQHEALEGRPRDDSQRSLLFLGVHDDYGGFLKTATSVLDGESTTALATSLQAVGTAGKQQRARITFTARYETPVGEGEIGWTIEHDLVTFEQVSRQPMSYWFQVAGELPVQGFFVQGVGSEFARESPASVAIACDKPCVVATREALVAIGALGQ